ncbi:MAG: hypothetical protein ABIK28_06580 [Planctomycetota bacterium]
MNPDPDLTRTKDKTTKRLWQQGECHVVLFCLTLVLFVWPFLGTSIADDLESLFVYLFSVWILVVALIFVVNHKRRFSEADQSEKTGS